jgi:hypothetical protein
MNYKLVSYFQISKAINISKYDDIAMRADIFAECQPFGAVCDLEQDLAKEVNRVLDECRQAEAESLLGHGDSECFSKKCFDVCGIGISNETEVCTVNRISSLLECGQRSGYKAWASLVHIEAKCCGKVAQPHYLTEVDHSFPI